MIIVFELDIPSLTEEGIQINNPFRGIQTLQSCSMINGLLIIEMLMLLNTKSLLIIRYLLPGTGNLFIHQWSGYQIVVLWNISPLLLNPLWFKEEFVCTVCHSLLLIFILSLLLKWDIKLFVTVPQSYSKVTYLIWITNEIWFDFNPSHLDTRPWLVLTMIICRLH